MPTRVNGTRWLSHVRRALGVMLNDSKGAKQYMAVYCHMEHIAAASTSTADVIGRAKKICKCLKQASFVAYIHFMLDVYELLSQCSLLLQKNITTLGVASASLNNCISTLESLTSESGDFSCNLQNFISHMNENGTFQGVKMIGADFLSNVTQFGDLPECHERQAMSALVKVSVEAITKRFASLLGFSSANPKTDQEKASKAVACLIHCFTPKMWPCATNEVIQYGKDQLTYLLIFFDDILTRNNMDKQRVCTQYRNLKLHCVPDFPHKSFHQLWALMLSNSPYNTLYGDVLNLVHLLLVIPVSSAECERVISTMNRIKCVDRPSLSTYTLDQLIRISAVGPAVEHFEPRPSVNRWLSSGERPRTCTYVKWPQYEDDLV